MLVFIFLIGAFLVNLLPALVIFDLGASQSFGSQSFRSDFDMNLGDVEYML